MVILMVQKNSYKKLKKNILLNSKKYFFEKLEKFSNREAIITEDSKIITYKELLTNIKEIEKIIKKQRNRIFLLADNSFEFLICYYAMLRKRSISFLLNSRLEKNKIYELIKIYKPHFIFDCEGLHDEKKKEYNLIKVFNNLKVFEIKSKINYRYNNELAQLISTSGSTGSPKFVKQSFENIQINTRDIVKSLKLNKNDKTITTMNPSYTYGLTKINTHIYVGGTIILNKKTLFDKEFWNKIKKFKVTNFGGVPFFFEILKKLNFHKFNLKNLKHITQAGGKLNLETLKYIYKKTKELKIKFYVMYGQTEAGPRITILNYKYLDEKINSVGKPIGKNQLWLQDKNGKKIKESNVIGDLYCKGKNVMIGYAYNLKDLEKKQVNNYINTGDLAYRDKNGFYYIAGRARRVIKPFGLRIDLEELERYLESKNFINCVCIGNDRKINIYSKYMDEISKIKKIVLNKLNLKKNIIFFYEQSKVPRDKNGKIIYKI